MALFMAQIYFSKIQFPNIGVQGTAQKHAAHDARRSEQRKTGCGSVNKHHWDLW
jgi:hypothetical protein